MVTQQTMKVARGPLNTPATPTLSIATQTSLTNVRPDYSTQSPLAISSKAAMRGGIQREGAEPSNSVGVAAREGPKPTMNGEEEAELGGVAKAKRIKLMSETEVVDRTKFLGVNSSIPMVTITNAASSVITGGHDLTGQTSLGMPVKLVNKNHQIRPPSVERTPSPSFATTGSSPGPSSPSPSLDSYPLSASPLPSRTASPLPPDTPPPPSPSPSNSSSTTHHPTSSQDASRLTPNPHSDIGSPLSIPPILNSPPPAPLSNISLAPSIPAPPPIEVPSSIKNTDGLLPTDVKVCCWGSCSR